ncbi:aminotransferase class V-fold PLP-dependent enzyme [Mycetohabitans sp. B46]
MLCDFDSAPHAKSQAFSAHPRLSFRYIPGLLLSAAPGRAQQVIREEWGRGLIRSWNSAVWFALPRRLGDELAKLIGGGNGEVVVTDTISINLFKLLSAALQAQDARDPSRRTIVSERANFPTDLYIAQGLIEQLDRGYTLKLVNAPAALPGAIGPDTAVVMLTHVNYRTCYMHEMAALTQLIHDNGALAVWDLAHSAGAVPVELNGAAADYAVGCTYQYLNGGPGAPAFLWVARQHQDAFSQPLSGWWGHRACMRPWPQTHGAHRT